MNDIISAIHSDGKKRLREAQQNSMKDESDPDEVLISVLAVGAMGGGLAGKTLVGMPLIGALLGSGASGYLILTNKTGENALADALRGISKEAAGVYRGARRMDQKHLISAKTATLARKIGRRSKAIDDEHQVTEKLMRGAKKAAKQAKRADEKNHYTDRAAAALSKLLDRLNKSI